MRPFRDMPISRKLLVALMGAALGALLVSLVAVVIYDQTTFRSRALSEHTTEALLMTHTLHAPLRFQDPEAATSNLASFEVDPEIRAAAVYAADGHLFASYTRKDATNIDLGPAPIHAGHSFTHRELRLVQPIIESEEQVGQLSLQVDLLPVYARLPRYGIMLGMVVLALVSVVVALSIPLKRFVTTPLLKLAELAQSVTARRDYHLRTEMVGFDEMGRLGNAFNQMLETIQGREAALFRSNADLETKRQTLEEMLALKEKMDKLRMRNEEEIRMLNAELEKRVQERTAQLVAANKELEAFSYSVSHDLRAPLRAIDGFSLALLEDSSDRLDENGKKDLQRVRAATQRMGGLIDDLLSLSRIVRKEIRREKADLSALAREILEEARSNEPQRSVDIQIQEGLIATGDAGLLRVALANLLDNAWKFTRRRAVAKIQFGSTSQEGQTVYFVKDNGAGFDMARAGKLFGAFQRFHRESEFEGTGIGLATVQRIISRHGGRVWAESALDQGATFYFTLP